VTTTRRPPRERRGTATTREVGSARALSTWERRRAARLLAAAATDKADLFELLDAVDLTAQDGKAMVADPFTCTVSSARGGC
jgi:hypothetical protein